MSLYTPVFPPLPEANSSQRSSLNSSSVAPPAKQQNYVKHLRDLHLFLSTQGDMLSPPSRPGSPMFDHRVQKVKDKIHDIFNGTEDTSSAKWTRASQVLKLGCVRGRYWSVSQDDPCPSEQNTEWILPDEECEWIEWEKKRAENRRRKTKTNASQQMDNSVPTAPDSHKPSYAGPGQPHDPTCNRLPPGISPSTIRAAKEKVRRWQASIPSEAWLDKISGSSPASTREVTAAAEGKHEITRPKRTLDFAVVKPTAKSFIGKRAKGFLSHPAIQNESAPTPSGRSKSPRPSQTSNLPQDKAPVDVDETASKEPAKTPSVKDDAPKIADVPETPFLPPSFPAHLQTSTPLDTSKMLVRTKPPPILPVSLSTPPPPTPANPPDDHQSFTVEPLDAKAASPLPPPTDTAQPEKRSRPSSMSIDGIPNDPPVTPPVKRPRTQSQNSSPPIPENPSKPISPNGALNAVPYCRDEARGPSPGAHRYPMESIEMALGIPLTPGKTDQAITAADVQDVAEKIPSPTKSVKSYFSAPDSDPVDSPVKGNLLLESPVSPMLSYAQNPSIFLPQVTSTQVGRRSPSVGRTNGGAFGYSSQFDVERHVDRVSELLEKDVDFDGWLRDARTVEMSQD